jgi:hypothetical protein
LVCGVKLAAHKFSFLAFTENTMMMMVVVVIAMLIFIRWWVLVMNR